MTQKIRANIVNSIRNETRHFFHHLRNHVSISWSKLQINIPKRSISNFLFIFILNYSSAFKTYQRHDVTSMEFMTIDFLSYSPLADSSILFVEVSQISNSTDHILNIKHKMDIKYVTVSPPHSSVLFFDVEIDFECILSRVTKTSQWHESMTKHYNWDASGQITDIGKEK